MFLLPQVLIGDTDVDPDARAALELARTFVSAGARSIQIRDPHGALSASAQVVEQLGALAGGVDATIHYDAALTDPRAMERVMRTSVRGIVVGMHAVFDPLQLRWVLDSLGARRAIVEIVADGEHLFDPPRNAFDMTVVDAVRALRFQGARHVLLRDVTALEPPIDRLRRICGDEQMNVTYDGPVRSPGAVQDLQVVGSRLHYVVVGDALLDGRLTVEEGVAAAGQPDSDPPSLDA